KIASEHGETVAGFRSQPRADRHKYPCPGAVCPTKSYAILRSNLHSKAYGVATRRRRTNPTRAIPDPSRIKLAGSGTALTSRSDVKNILVVAVIVDPVAGPQLIVPAGCWDPFSAKSHGTFIPSTTPPQAAKTGSPTELGLSETKNKVPPANAFAKTKASLKLFGLVGSVIPKDHKVPVLFQEDPDGLVTLL